MYLCLFVPILEEEVATSDITETLFVIFISGVQQQHYKVTYKQAYDIYQTRCSRGCFTNIFVIPCVRCHVSHVMCHRSLFSFSFTKCWSQSVEGLLSTGLPRLVLSCLSFHLLTDPVQPGLATNSVMINQLNYTVTNSTIPIFHKISL